jgi:hypothetical protein
MVSVSFYQLPLSGIFQETAGKKRVGKDEKNFILVSPSDAHQLTDDRSHRR